MERNCHLTDHHKVIMAVNMTAIKNQKNLHTLLDKPPYLKFKRRLTATLAVTISRQSS